MTTIKIQKPVLLPTIERASLFLSFPYDAEIIDNIRELPVRKYHGDSKEWEIPFSALNWVLDLFANTKINIIAEDASIFQEPSKALPPEFMFKTSPYSHQIEGFTYGLENDHWLLGDEQGLGKTKQVIDIAVAKKYQRNYEHCLIICGVNGLKWNWLNEIETHSNETGWVLGQKSGRTGIKIGSTTDKIKDLDRVDDLPYFIITNIESFRTDEIADKVASLCKSGKIGMIAADEVHKMKNPSSQQGKGFLKAQAQTMIAMTGTPLMNTPLDLYIILKWLGIENHSFYQFKNHYAIMGGYGNHQIIGYRCLDDLQKQLNSIMLRRLKADVLDLPEKTFIDEYVEMTGKQAQLYKEITNDILANIDKVKMAPNPLAELIRLRQVTGYPGIVSSTILESAKLDRMEELVEDAVANGKKVVIFSNWSQMTDEIYLRLHNYHPAVITGQTDDASRQDEVKHFQNDADCKVIIGTTGAMGTGLTLTAGTVEIFLDEPWNMALKDQAVDRCHRIGQNNNVTIYTLLTKHTIDEKIHKLVYKKGAMADKLVDGKVENTDKGALVDYLLS